MKKVHIREIYLWTCPYKTCNHENEESFPADKKVKCQKCGRISKDEDYRSVK